MRVTVWLLCLLAVQVSCETTHTPEAKSSTTAPTTTTTTTTTTIPTTLHIPPAVTQVTVTDRSETHLELQWDKVNNNNDYSYTLSYNGGEEISITAPAEGTTVTYTVSSLTPGTNYTFTLYTVFGAQKSTAHLFSEVTVPPAVTQVTVTDRSETHLELQWDKVNNNNDYSYTLSYNGGEEISITVPAEVTTVTYTVSSLTPGTNYTFTLYTVFGAQKSTAHLFSEVTVPPAVTQVTVTDRSETHLELQWDKVNNNNDYTYTLSYNGGEEISITVPAEVTTVTYTVSSLTPGTNYTFTLYTVFGGQKSTAHVFSEVTVPPAVTQVTVTDRSETHLELQWDKVNNNNDYTYTLSYNGGEEISITAPAEGTTVTYTVSSLTPGTNYTFTLYTVFGAQKSTAHVFSEVTVPPAVTQVTVTDRSETHLELQWTKPNNNNDYSYTLSYNGGEEIPITAPAEGTTVTHNVSPLTPGTNYTFTLFTVFGGQESTELPFSAVTVPDNVAEVTVQSRSETHLELQWPKVKDNNEYTYTLIYTGAEETNITTPAEGNTVTHNVSSLTAGTKYDFTLFTVFGGVNSSAYDFSSVTVPLTVTKVNVETISETELKLEWNKVNNNNDYTYILRFSNGTDINITGPAEGNTVTHTVSPLSAGTKFSFTLFTVFEGVNSEGYSFAGVTEPRAVSEVDVKNRTDTQLELQWSKVNNRNDYTYILKYNGEEIPITAPADGTTVTYTVSSLTPGTNYTFTLYTVFGEVRSREYPFSEMTVPARVTGLKCIPGDFSVTLKWDKLVGVSTGIEVNISGKSYPVEPKTEWVVSGLQPAKTYDVTVTSLSGKMKSAPEPTNCQTHSTVIWVPVLVIILLAIILMGVFILRRKPQLLSKVHMPMHERNTEMDPSRNTFKPIPMKKFPDHFNQMSCDDNREFSDEYMQFNTVGTEQAQREALLPDNKSKNRFTDILPYDSSRVKLSTQGQASDYINANYIPGYGGKNKDYIAAQGPLPSTVTDFWRMVWEQGSTRIVMVTNCVENGRTKCEKYWPEDRSPCRYGDLVINMTLEHKDTDWTVREFTVKNERTSEQRVVKHFHFTAWPDHGVPDGTAPLIEFRSLIRQHIDTSSPAAGPTVVHCSAGVGRTGTLIALDVLLQQLEKEDAVNIGGFVHRMRRQRPRMVQTESQYIFLHQCINDTLTLPAEEPMYMNQGINGGGAIYENIGAV